MAAVISSSAAAIVASSSTAVVTSSSDGVSSAVVASSSTASSSARLSSSSSSVILSSSVISSSISSSSSIPSTSSTTSTTSTTSTRTSSSSTTSSTPIVTVTSTVSQPSLVTSVNPSSRISSTASSSAAAASSSSKGGVAGSGLSVGAFVGIIIGGVAAIALIGILATRQLRKRNRATRTANRSSMFEPWPAPAPVSLEDEPYEKPTYDPPSQTYQMQEQSYDGYQAYPAGGQPVGYGQAQGQYPPDHYGFEQGYAHGGYPPQQGYGQYPPQVYADQPAQAYDHGYDHHAAMAAGAAGVGAGAVMAAAAGSQDHAAAEHPSADSPPAAAGLHDAMMVRVKVGFVRSLEDELAVAPGQQLYLHTAYDDGWSMCEDQNQNRGVVPLSCLEPWQESLAPVNNEAGGQSLENTTRRRSSLYQNAQAAGLYLNMAHGN